MDDQQRARELLAFGLDEYGHHVEAENVRKGIDLDVYRTELWSITAALRAAPEGFVVVPAEPTENAIEAICMAHGHGVWPEGYGKGARALRRAAASNGYRAALDARPQGVKDA